MTTALRGTARGFTLLELLIVLGLIAAISVVTMSGIFGTGKAGALQSGQATLVNSITAARLKAMSSGRRARLLINADPTYGGTEHFLRYVVIQLAREAGNNPANWDTVGSALLPDGVYVVPSSLQQYSGLIEDESDWRRTTNQSLTLASEALNQTVSLSLDLANQAQLWTGFEFTVAGTTAPLAGLPQPQGIIVLALGERRRPGTYGPGQSPLVLANSNAVRGLTLSVYGIPNLVNERTSF